MIETTNSSVSYIADGIQTEWAFPYHFIKPEDIELYVTIGQTRTKIAFEDFSVDTETGVVTYPLSGDPVPASATVELIRNTEITQLEDSSIVAFKSADVERIADKLTMICQDKYTLVKAYEQHLSDTDNPHNVTKAQVGLGNVDNTADLDKPVSTATQAALNTKQDVGDYATNSALTAGLATKQDVISDLATIRSGAASGATAVQPSALATVATSGSYNDLLNKPTLGTMASESANDYTKTANLSAVAISGNFSDLNGKPGIVDLKDVSISSPTAAQVLSYDATTQKWKNSSSTATVAWGGITGTLNSQTDLQTALNAKQDTLVSGTNIKTVNGNSLLGNGNLDIDGLPSQTGQSGKFLTTDGTDANWANIPPGVSADGTTIENNSNVFTTVGVKDQKTSNANKMWTGTKAEYDAIVSKDANTFYHITDDEPNTVAYAKADLSNLTHGLENTICTTPATTTSTATSAKPAVVVENYVNGTSWYRVYSDGWCEQGGFCAAVSSVSTASVIYIKPFKDANYTLSTTMSTPSTQVGQTNWCYVGYNTKTATGFTQIMADLNTYQYGLSWQASGYIA